MGVDYKRKETQVECEQVMGCVNNGAPLFSV